jgi:hypothetical protein
MEHTVDDRGAAQIEPGAAREAQQHCQADDSEQAQQHDCPAQGCARKLGQRIDDRRDQEWSEHVGVLEEARGATIARHQVIGTGKQVEVAGDARRGRHKRCPQIGI